MKKVLYFLILFYLTSCSTGKITYWCGDHPCINKKEKVSYFKKTGIVEMREINKQDLKAKSELEKIIQQAKLNEKKRINDEKNVLKILKREEKMRIKREKKLEKEAIKSEKQRLKDEKNLEKEAIKKEKKRLKEEKELEKRISKDEKISTNENIILKKDPVEYKLFSKKVESSKFADLANQILKRNSTRSFPDINNIPE